MIPNDVLDEIIASLNPEFVPIKFIIMARIIDENGIEHVLRGDELAVFLRSPIDNFREARVILDARRLKLSIIQTVADFWKRVDARLADDK